MTYDNHTFEDQELYLSGMFLNGVQSYYSTFTLPDEDVMALGYTNPVAGAPDSNLAGEVSINRLIVGAEDPLTGFFEGGISGHFNYDEGSSYLFDQGYISNYNCICAVNEIPELNTILETYGTMKGSIVGEGDQPGPEDPNADNLVITAPGDLSLEITNYNGPQIDLSTNAVQSFEYNIIIEWEPLYSVGSLKPQGYMTRGPVLVETILTVELNDSVPPDFSSLICTPNLKDLTIKIRKCDSGCGEAETIRKFVAPCSKLIEYTQISSIEDVLIVEMVFKSTTTSVAKLGEIVSN